MAIWGVLAMAMVAQLRAVSPAQLAELKKTPESIASIGLPPLDTEKLGSADWAEVRPEMLKLARFASTQMDIHDFESMLKLAEAKAPKHIKRVQDDRKAFEEALKPDPSQLTLGKFWHGLHFVLTGVPEGGASPWKDVIMGGIAFGPDYGYGKTTYRDTATVKRVAAALSKLEPSSFAARCNPAKLNDAMIYPPEWTRDGCDALTTAYGQVREFYRRAAARGEAVLFWVRP